MSREIIPNIIWKCLNEFLTWFSNSTPGWRRVNMQHQTRIHLIYVNALLIFVSDAFCDFHSIEIYSNAARSILISSSHLLYPLSSKILYNFIKMLPEMRRSFWILLMSVGRFLFTINKFSIFKYRYTYLFKRKQKDQT